MRIALDGMGGDGAPVEVVSGAIRALDELSGLEVLLVGDPGRMGAPDRPGLVIHPATDVIGMDEHPAQAVRAKPDASIPTAVRLVKEGAADAVVSAGNTGAMMASSLLILGRVAGVKRPAIATVIPTRGRPLVCVDMGATADCKPEHLLQFAHMGVAYAEAVLDVERPTVALLNIGGEPEKGSVLAQETHALLAADERLRFVGNVEGNHLLDGDLDVMVTDGFTGNVVLKVLEGTAESLFAQVKNAFMSSARGRLAGQLARPLLHGLKKRLDYEEYGGAPLLGVTGVSIISHGRSSARAIAAAVGAAKRAVDGGLTQRIAHVMRAEGAPEDPGGADMTAGAAGGGETRS